jgi:taurine dioxygenase
MEVPSHGGRTWFCNMHSVYEALHEATRKRIDGKRAIHGYDTARARNRPSARTVQEIAETPDVEHPLVRTPSRHRPQGALSQLQPARPHRRHGARRKRRAARRTRREARKPCHHFGHEWKVGDCVVWDNRATMHRVDVDYPLGERRIMQRVLIEGDKPF